MHFERGGWGVGACSRVWCRIAPHEHVIKTKMTGRTCTMLSTHIASVAGGGRGHAAACGAHLQRLARCETITALAVNSDQCPRV